MNLIDALKNPPVIAACDRANCYQCTGHGTCIDWDKWQKQVLEAVAEMLPKEHKQFDVECSAAFKVEGYNLAISDMRRRLKAEKEALK